MKRYGTLLCDPPWRFETWSPKGWGNRHAATHYDVLKTSELMGLPVGEFAAPNCRLFLWVVDSFLPQGLQLGQAWGFSYSTVAFVWNKVTTNGKPFFGGGHCTRKGSEFCLLFLKGKLGRRSASVRQVITAPVREHSRKPDEVYERIEALVDGPYLELFARTKRAGWDQVGDQMGRWAA